MKKKRWFTMIGSICLSLVLAALLLPGCAPAAPEEVAEEIAELEAEIDDLEGDVAAEKAKTDAEKAKVSDLEKEIAALKKPAEVIEWRAATCWTPAIAFLESDEHYCDVMRELTDGRLDIEVYVAGALMKPTEILDAVTVGTVEAGFDWPGYWGGKNKAFDLIGSSTTLFTQFDYVAWIWGADGLEVYKELFGPYNVEYWPTWLQSCDAGMHGNKPIRSLADYKGQKLRMCGYIPGRVVEKLGATVVMLAGGEIYGALEKGVIDNAEFANPYIGYNMGFSEVTEYLCSPGWWQPAALGGILINQDTWNELPGDIKYAAEIAARENMIWSSSRWEYLSAEAIEKFEADGVEITQLSHEDLLELEEIAHPLMLELAETEPDYAKVLLNQMLFLQETGRWRAAQHDYASGRNIPDIDEYVSRLKEIVK